MDTRQAAKLAVLQERKAQLKRELSDVESEIKNLQPLLLEQMDQDGVDKLRVKVGEDDDGNPVYRTVYTRRELWAGYEHDRDSLIEALKTAGLEDYVNETFNTPSLSAYVRAMDPDKRLSPEEIKALLPKAIQGEIKISEKREIRSRR